MRLFPFSSSLDGSPTAQNNREKSQALVYLNVYDLTPVNNYIYWFGLGIYHSGIEDFLMFIFSALTRAAALFDMLDDCGGCLMERELNSFVHGLEYGFGAHEFPTSGVFEVEPRSCPGFIFRRSIILGSTDMSRSEFRSFMEHLSTQYHGDTYHLIYKNCNHFTDEVSQRLSGKPIPGWVNRLARVGSYCNCLLPESIQATSVRHLPEDQMNSEDGSDSGASSISVESDAEDLDHHHLLVTPNSDVAFLMDKPVRLAKDVL